MRTSRFLTLSLALTLLFAATAMAADVYVRAGADGKGTKDAPYGEMWKAVDRAKRGDVIHVAAGTYNGKGGSGHFKVGVPQLTLVGGYTADFSARNPFANLTILERAKDYKGDWTGLPEGIIAGDASVDHSGMTVDGFVLNGASRNDYTDGGTKINMKKSYHGSLFQASKPNIKIRNCVLVNPCGNGIYVAWQGEENEVSNCVVANWMYSGIETRSAQPDSKILIKNNFIGFGWFEPGKGGSIGVFVGRQGQTIIENNVLAFLQTEGGESGFGVSNTFANSDTIMKGNVFFSCTGGFYKYMDDNKASLVLWKNSELEEANDEDNCEDYMLAESGDNREAEPGLKPDQNFATIFANFVGSEPGKLNMDLMNQWRRSVGLPLQAENGTARQNYAPEYPLSGIPGLQSSIAGVGVRFDAKLETYASAGDGASVPDSFEDAAVEDFKKGGARGKGNNGTAVIFQAGMGADKMVFEIDQAPRTDYVCVELLKSGEKPGATRELVFGYLLKGSEAHNDWVKNLKKRDKINDKGGLWIKGQAYDFKNQSYNYPVGIVIHAVDTKKK